MNRFIDTYQQIQQDQKGFLRPFLRSLALDVFSAKGTLLQEDELLTKPRIQFLYFHHIFKDEVKNFDKLVAFLAEKHVFISHSEAVDRLIHDKIDKPYIAWSSDDGIHNNMLAAKVLNAYDASCCFYINPFSIGLTDTQSIQKFCREQLAMPPVAFLDWNNVETLQKQGHEIGNHTFKHDMVSELSTSAFEADFLKTDAILREKCGPIKHFAYTYGTFAHFNKAAFDVVYKNGYDSCTSAVRGCHTNGQGKLDKHSVFLRRDQIIADWKLTHIKYFLRKSVKNMRYTNNFLPQTYF